MPDILIRGIKIPTSGQCLKLMIHCNGQVVIDRGTYWDEAEAIELPEHGELIDRDALPEGRLEWEDIDDAPVIVPSNKEETE